MKKILKEVMAGVRIQTQGQEATIKNTLWSDYVISILPALTCFILITNQK